MTNRLAHLLPLGFFTLLAVIILHPIIAQTGTHAAGFDYFVYHWNFWWIRHALTTPGLSVFATDFVFFPFMNNMGYHAYSAFWFPVWAVLEPLIGTLPAMTVIIVFGAILNGWLLYLWLRRLDVAPALALLGGMALQCAPLVRYFYYNTHINLMDWFWLPAHLLLWHQIVTVAENRRWRRLMLWAVIEGAACSRSGTACAPCQSHGR
jgi:multidrug transporter EmrE-like cation transporter